MNEWAGINVFLFLTIFYMLAYQHLSSYEEEWSAPGRGMEKLKGKWTRIFQWSAIGGYASALAAWIVTAHNPFIMLALGIIGAAATFMSITDFRTGRAPIELNGLTCWVTLPLLLGIPLGLAPTYGNAFLYGVDSSVDQFAQFGLYLFIPIFFLAAALLGKGGLADVYALLFLGYAMSWWVGIGNIVWILMVACALQLIVIAVGNKVNWERGVVKSDSFGTKNRKKQPRAWPFLPALCASFIVGGLIIAGMHTFAPVATMAPAL